MSGGADVPRPRFATAAEWREHVQRFERAELSPAEWDHDGHLAVAIWYSLWFDADDALVRVRDGIRRLNAVHERTRPAKVGYHETLTRFYMQAVRRRVAAHAIEAGMLHAVHDIIGELGDRSLPLRYYSEARLFSPDARAGWVPPDLRALD